MRTATHLATSLLLHAGCAARPLEQAEPPQDLLNITRAHELGGQWSNLTKFCVAEDGTTTQIRTVHGSGDPWLDELFRDTVAKWRYTPGRAGCQQYRFSADFGPDVVPGASGGPPVSRDENRQAITVRAIDTPMPTGSMFVDAARRAGIHAWTLTNRTAYCIGPDGDVRDVATLRSSGVAEIDELLRAAIGSWRYAPVTVDGKPACVRTDYMFVLTIR